MIAKKNPGKKKLKISGVFRHGKTNMPLWAFSYRLFL
jgi:hypothetical protein